MLSVPVFSYLRAIRTLSNGCIGNSLETNCSSTTWQNCIEPRSFVTGLRLSKQAIRQVGTLESILIFMATQTRAAQRMSLGDGITGKPSSATPLTTTYSLSNNGVERHLSDYEADYLPR